MQFQFDIAPTASVPQPRPPVTESAPELLRQLIDIQRDGFAQMVELQREHLNHVRAMSQDSVARWRNLLARWETELPEFAENCKKAYPLLERSYIHLLSNLVEDLAHQGDDALETEFAVQEFLDRYAMKVGQLSHLLSIIGPLSEAAQQNEAAKQQQAK